MGNLYGLSESSIKILHQLITNERNRCQNPLQRPAVPINNSYYSPVVSGVTDCYIAFSLETIPALYKSDDVDATPGVGECGIYHLDEFTSILTDMSTTLPVYNLFTTPIQAGTFFPIVREKGGRWLVQSEQAAESGNLNSNIINIPQTVQTTSPQDFGLSLPIAAGLGPITVTAQIVYACSFTPGTGVSTQIIELAIYDTISGIVFDPQHFFGQGYITMGSVAVGGNWFNTANINVYIPGPTAAMNLDIKLTGNPATFESETHSKMWYIQYP